MVGLVHEMEKIGGGAKLSVKTMKTMNLLQLWDTQVGVFGFAQGRGLSGEKILGGLVVLTVLSKPLIRAQREYLDWEEQRKQRAPAMLF